MMRLDRFLSETTPLTRSLAKAALFPGTVEHVLNEYALIDSEERRLNELITGYLDTSEEDFPPPTQANNNNDAAYSLP